MTAPHADQIIAGYVARLEAALGPVATSRRQELLDDVRGHIAEARGALSNETDADLLNILDRLGDPAETAAAEMGRAEATSPNRGTSRFVEISAIVLLLLIWPVGVVLLWISDAWTTRDKLVGTLVPPGGYLAILFGGPVLLLAAFGTACVTVSDESGRVLSTTCPSGADQTLLNIGLTLLVVIFLVSPILSAIYLGVRLRRGRRLPHRIGRNEAAAPLVDLAGSP